MQRRVEQRRVDGEALGLGGLRPRRARPRRSSRRRRARRPARPGRPGRTRSRARRGGRRARRRRPRRRRPAASVCGAARRGPVGGPIVPVAWRTHSPPSSGRACTSIERRAPSSRRADRHLQLHAALGGQRRAARRASARRPCRSRPRRPRAARARRTRCPGSSTSPSSVVVGEPRVRAQRQPAGEQPRVLSGELDGARRAAGARSRRGRPRQRLRGVARAGRESSQKRRRWNGYVGSSTRRALAARERRRPSRPRRRGRTPRRRTCRKRASVPSSRRSDPTTAIAAGSAAAASTVSCTAHVSTGCGLTSTNAVTPSSSSARGRLLEAHGLAQVAVPVPGVELARRRRAPPVVVEHERDRGRWRGAIGRELVEQLLADRVDLRGVRRVVDGDHPRAHAVGLALGEQLVERVRLARHDASSAGRCTAATDSRPSQRAMRSCTSSAGSDTDIIPPAPASCDERAAAQRDDPRGVLAATARRRRTRRRSRPASGRRPPPARRRRTRHSAGERDHHGEQRGLHDVHRARARGRRRRRAGRRAATSRRTGAARRRTRPSARANTGDGRPTGRAPSPATASPGRGTRTRPSRGRRAAPAATPSAGSPSASAAEPGEQLGAVGADDDRTVREAGRGRSASDQPTSTGASSGRALEVRRAGRARLGAQRGVGLRRQDPRHRRRPAAGRRLGAARPPRRAPPRGRRARWCR